MKHQNAELTFNAPWETPRWMRALGAAPLFLDPGWIRSRLAMRPVDAWGRPVPWITYDAMVELRKRARPGLRVFEWGAGYSTLWWLAQGCEVVACEHDPAWADEVRQMAPNAVVAVRAPDLYATEALRHEPFDVVVIDGSARNDCARNAAAALRPGGFILFDNSDREQSRDGLLHLGDQGFMRHDFEGFGPINGFRWRTSIFER